MAEEVQNGIAPTESEAFVPQQVQLAPGVGENVNPAAAESPLYTQQQMIDRDNALEAAKQKEQGGQVSSLLNASSPTPLATGATPPMSGSIADTLSNVGKIEPGELAKDAAAMQGKGPRAVQATDASKYDIQAQNPAAAAVSDPFAEAQAATLKSYAAQEKANNSIAGAVGAKAIADQAQFAEAEKAYATAEIERKATREKFETDYAGKIQNYEKSLADYQQAAGQKVIPGQLLANMDTGSKIQSGLFMALSAYGSALSGQDSQAMKVINNAITQDIEAQKFNIENKLKGARVGLEGSQYLVSQMRENFRDDEAATLASRAAMLAMTQQRLNVNASKLDQSTAGPKAAALNGQLEVQKQQALQQLRVQQAQTYMMNQLSQGGAAVKDLSPMQVSMIPDKATRESYVKGYGVGTSGAEGAKELQKVRGEAEPAINGINRVLQLTDDYNRVTDRTKREEIKTELASLTSSLQPLLIGSKRLSELGMDQITKAIGDPTALLTMPAIQRHKMMTVNNKIISDLNNTAKQYGYTPIYSTQNQNSNLYTKPKK